MKKEESMEERTNRMEKEMHDLVIPENKVKNGVVTVDDDVLNEDPFDEKWVINDGNRIDRIKYFETLIRGSFEYRWFIDTLKNTLDVKHCVFFRGYSITNGMKLEFHHHPFTLFDYTDAVVTRQMEENDVDYVIEQKVCEEVVKLHYRFMVGLVPLDPTSHELVHDGKLDIHPMLVKGDYNRFFEEYNKYIPDATKSKYTEWLTDKHSTSDLEIPEIFEYKPISVVASNKQIVDEHNINQLLLSDKMKNVNNEFIAKLLEGGDKK